MKLCVITPTFGRETLRRLLVSDKLAEGDEWLVIGDGPQPHAEAVCDELRILPYLRYVEGPLTNDRRNSQRDLGMRLALADYLIFADDDDVFVPGAIKTIRRQLTGNPFMFRIWHNGGVIWQNREIVPGNVGRSMFVVPNNPRRLARWADDPTYAGDVSFIQNTMKFYQLKDLVWAGEIIQVMKPETSDEWKHLA